MSGLVAGIVADARNALGAGVDQLRGEVDGRLASFGTSLTPMLTACGLLIVLVSLGGLAIAASLVALGLPIWAAMWIVTAIAGAASYIAIRRAQPPARPLAS